MIMYYVVLMEQSGSSCPKWPDERRPKNIFFKYWILSLWILAMCAQKQIPLKLYAKQHIFELFFALCLFQLLWEEVRGFPETGCPPEGVPGPHEPEMTRAVLVRTFFGVSIAMTSPHTGNKNSGPYYAGFLFLLVTLMVQFFFKFFFIHVPGNLNSLSQVFIINK